MGHLLMGCRDAVKRMRHKQVCVFRISLIHVYYSIYSYYLQLFVIHVLLLDTHVDIQMYISLSIMCCISAERKYVCQTVGVCIGKWLPD